MWDEYLEPCDHIWINLDHPCYGVDVIFDDDHDYHGQGYLTLTELIKKVSQLKEIITELTAQDDEPLPFTDEDYRVLP